MTTSNATSMETELLNKSRKLTRMSELDLLIIQKSTTYEKLREDYYNAIMSGTPMEKRIIIVKEIFKIHEELTNLYEKLRQIIPSQ